MNDFHSPDRPALFAAVLAAPNDDAPKLVFADWLEESGDRDDLRMARTLRWMAAYKKWPRVFGARDWMSRESFWTCWLSGLPAIVADGWEVANYLPKKIAERLRGDQFDGVPRKGAQFMVGRKLRFKFHVGTFDLKAEAVAVAIEHLSNALTDADIRAASRRLRNAARV